MNFIKEKGIFLIDLLLLPLTYLSSLWLHTVRKINTKRMKLSNKIFRLVGLFPIRDHYHEPLFNPKELRYSLRKDRVLPGIDFNVEGQLELLTKFRFNEELSKLPLEKTNTLEFYYNNDSFGPVDSQYLYNIIRLYKPNKIVEIGSGYSTLMSIKAISENKNKNREYRCEHTCIEPYERKWLGDVGIKLIRKRAEELSKDIFHTLESGDILFIDSSHVIRPQGDVLFEFLEILPILKPGVIVHIHDIFTPKDYLEEWRFDEVKLWNEQYLLEAFLAFNKEYKIIGAANYLKHNYFSELIKACPLLKPSDEPCWFWIRRK